MAHPGEFLVPFERELSIYSRLCYNKFSTERDLVYSIWRAQLAKNELSWFEKIFDQDKFLYLSFPNLSHWDLLHEPTVHSMPKYWRKNELSYGIYGKIGSLLECNGTNSCSLMYMLPMQWLINNTQKRTAMAGLSTNMHQACRRKSSISSNIGMITLTCTACLVAEGRFGYSAGSIWVRHCRCKNDSWTKSLLALVSSRYATICSVFAFGGNWFSYMIHTSEEENGQVMGFVDE